MAVARQGKNVPEEGCCNSWYKYTSGQKDETMSVGDGRKYIVKKAGRSKAGLEVSSIMQHTSFEKHIRSI